MSLACVSYVYLNSLIFEVQNLNKKLLTTGAQNTLKLIFGGAPTNTFVGTDPTTLLILLLLLFFFLLLGDDLQKTLGGHRRLKSDRDEIWQDCSH